MICLSFVFPIPPPPPVLGSFFTIKILWETLCKRKGLSFLDSMSFLRHKCVSYELVNKAIIKQGLRRIISHVVYICRLINNPTQFSNASLLLLNVEKTGFIIWFISFRITHLHLLSQLDNRMMLRHEEQWICWNRFFCPYIFFPSCPLDL